MANYKDYCTLIERLCLDSLTNAGGISVFSLPVNISLHLALWKSLRFHLITKNVLSETIMNKITTTHGQINQHNVMTFKSTSNSECFPRAFPISSAASTPMVLPSSFKTRREEHASMASTISLAENISHQLVNYKYPSNTNGKLSN